MDSLAQPQTVTDVDNAKDLSVDQGEIRLVGLAHHYGKNVGGLNGIDLTIAP